MGISLCQSQVCFHRSNLFHVWKHVSLPLFRMVSGQVWQKKCLLLDTDHCYLIFAGLCIQHKYLDVHDWRILSIIHFVFTHRNNLHSWNGIRGEGERLSRLHPSFARHVSCFLGRLFYLFDLYICSHHTNLIYLFLNSNGNRLQDWTLVAGNVYPIAFVVGEMALAGIFYLVRDWRLALIIITLFNLSMTMLPL